MLKPSSDSELGAEKGKGVGDRTMQVEADRLRLTIGKPRGSLSGRLLGPAEGERGVACEGVSGAGRSTSDLR